MIYRDKRGMPFEVRPFEIEDFSLLKGMYDTFSPKGRFQGLPPINKQECDRWINRLFENGENLLASRTGKVVGHTVILPDLQKIDAEYLIFVNQFDRGLGVGTKLTRAAQKQAKEMGLNLLWLTVDAYNIRATKLYKKCGFDFDISYKSTSERMMLYRCRKNHYA